MLKSDQWIREHGSDILDPFVPIQIRGNGIVSFGTSSYGYDLRMADEFKVLNPRYTAYGSAVLDPKNPIGDMWLDVQCPYLDIHSNSMVLVRSVEYIRMPRSVLGIVLGKSTYARLGLVANITPLEPEWEGYLTIELSNTTPLAVRVYALEGIAQLLFFEGEPCEVSYADRGGKYQAQRGVTTARVEP